MATTRMRVTTYTDEDVLTKLGEIAYENGLSLAATASYLIQHGMKRIEESDIPITKIGK